MKLFLDIKDKIKIRKKKKNEELFCPPHRFPHKLPFTKSITDEPCHFHNKKWRMAHHKFFCSFLSCPHYKRMLKEYKKSKAGWKVKKSKK